MSAETFSGASPEPLSDLRSKASEFGEAAAKRVDDTRGAAAARMDSAAASLHSHANDLPGGQRATELAHGAANKISATADYVRTHELSAMFRDVKTIVRNNPVPALIGAAALGFLLAKAFSRN